MKDTNAPIPQITQNFVSHLAAARDRTYRVKDLKLRVFGEHPGNV